MEEREERAGTEHDRLVGEERVALLSVLQELTVAALDLFDPQASADRFMDRVAERMDCVAAMWLERDARGNLRLAGAAGLSHASRLLPLGWISESLSSEKTELLLPYPELERPKILRWLFPLPAIGEAGSSSALLLFFADEPQYPQLYRGMFRRLGVILGKVLQHRQLLVTTLENERRLHQQKTLLVSQSEASVEGILLVSTDGRILSYNRRFVEMWGASKEIKTERTDEVLRVAAERVIDPGAMLREIAKLEQHPEVAALSELRLKDGRILERYSAPIRSEDGVLYGRGLYFRDITEQRHAEAQRDRLFALEQQARRQAEAEERRSAFLAEATGVLASRLEIEATLEALARLAVARWTDGCIIDVRARNHSFRRLTIAYSDPALEKWARDLGARTPDLREEHGPGRALRTGEAERTATRLCTPIVARGQLVGAITLLRSDANLPFQQVDQDLAQALSRRAALAIDNASLYRQAQQAVRLRDEFLSVASHELKTPVTSLQLVVQRALRLGQECEQRQGVASEPMRRAFETIERQTRRLSRLVNVMLDVSRIHAGRVELEFEEVDVADVVQRVVGRFEEEIARSGSVVTVRADSSVRGQLDRSRVDQVITNLLSNAIQNGAGNPIDLMVERAGGTARLIVRDRGIGIPADRLEKIFEPFERAFPSRPHGGLGLGLHIVQTIVEMMKGTIEVESELGKGTTFTVRLPLNPAG